MTLQKALTTAKEFGFTPLHAGGGRWTLAEARHIRMTAHRAARISLLEWRAALVQLIDV